MSEVILNRGECECGCKGKTTISPYDNPSRGHRKGEPRRFIKGHERRKAPEAFIVNGETGCWEWQWSKTSRGYATTKNHDGRTVEAHRLYYIQKYGDPGPDMELDHICRNRSCVNPDHLDPVTHAENMRRSPKVTRLSREQILEILSLKGKLIQREIAERFDISPQYVGQLHKGIWRKDIYECQK